MTRDPSGTELPPASVHPAAPVAAWVDLVRLVEEHHADLYRYAYRLSGTAADAEDLTQEVFLIAQQKLDQVRDAECVRGWLFAVLRNCYLGIKRRPTPIAATNMAVDLDSLPEAVDRQDIDREQLQAAINELPDEFKLVVLQYYFEDRSYREISEQMQLPIGTVMSRLSRAKAHLRRRLLEDLTKGEAKEIQVKKAKVKLS
jgi:RNA polymerase sigma-70 factor (ECF subfamily)